jgi:uncharacterized glyoxalase superfamily protein PhnB
MPKRSLHPGNGEQQLNQAVDAMFSRTNSKRPKVEKEIEPLVRIAAELRNLPSASFKARLKSQLLGKKHMSTVAEPIVDKTAAVPPGFRMVTPYLVAADGHALLDFVKAAFGAEEKLRIETPMGGVHGEMRIGDSMLMLGGGVPGKKFPGSLQPAALHVYVKDCDAVCANALAAGANLIDEARDQEYGERSATVKDAAGNFWYIATAKGESHVPQGLHNVNPYLHPRRAEPLIAFLKRAFAAEEVAKYASPDGVVNHAVVRVGDSIVEMGEAHGKYETMPAMFYLYVPNVDAVYRQAVAAGAISFQEPADQPYGDRTAAVRDNFGNKWYIATHVKDVEV